MSFLNPKCNFAPWMPAAAFFLFALKNLAGFLLLDLAFSCGEKCIFQPNMKNVQIKLPKSYTVSSDLLLADLISGGRDL